MFKAVHVNGFGFNLIFIAAPLAAVGDVVGIKEHLVIAFFRNADAVIEPFDVGEIANGDDFFPAFVYSPERDNGIVFVVGGNPGEPLP